MPSGAADFRRDVLEGLRRARKSIPCKYLYDERGSYLFNRIVATPDYYPPRVEREIMRAHAAEIARRLGTGCYVIEPGAGSGVKVRMLLDQLDDVVAYAPIDISSAPLEAAVRLLARDYPSIEILPVEGDFTAGIEAPPPRGAVRRRVIYFPGSTIGNFDPSEASRLLRDFARAVRPGGAILVGADLRKDPAILERAYDDREGWTAAFNLNLLERMNRELGANFRVDRFQHSALYDPEFGRIEMCLRSLCRQAVAIGDERFWFEEGETIHTESAHKYTIEGFREIAGRAGLESTAIWTDPAAMFGVFYLRVG